MITKDTLISGSVCGIICVLYMALYMHFFGMGAGSQNATHLISGMSMESMMIDMTARMQGKTGKDLEKVFITDMIPHHQGAVDMAQLLLKDTSVRPELSTFAQEIISAQEKEIEQMKIWLENYQ